MAPSKWLDAVSDQHVSLHTLPSCMTLCDLKNDNYHKLVAAEIPVDITTRAKLKVYKGTGMVSEQGLPGIPSAVESFYIDEPEPRSPIIAVAIGASVLFYRNMKPYYKFTLPSMSIEPLERDVWRKLPLERPENQETLIDNLRSIEVCQLSWISQKLFNLPVSERESFIKDHAETELQRLSMITAMTTLQRSSSDTKPHSALVIATESGDIIILDTLTFGILYEAKVCSYQVSPSLLSSSGNFDVDFRMVIATRESSLCLLRKSWLEGRQILKMEQPVIDITLLPVDQTIVVLCMDQKLTCYSKKGKKLWTVPLRYGGTCMVPVPLPHLGITLTAVAMVGGLVQLYSQKSLVDEFTAHETISAMIFGHLGQEEHVLTLVTENGDLLIKILKRTAEFKAYVAPPTTKSDTSDEGKALEIPKKNTIFVEQTQREKDSAKAIYNSFQAELWRLRLTAARATVEAITSAESTISGDLRHAPIKLSAEVCGVGPQFRLFLTIENMSTRKEANNLSILLHADHRHYKLSKPMAKLPVLIPGVPLKVDFEVTAVLDPIDGLPPPDLTTENSNIRVMIIKLGQAKPLIAAVVTMPESEAPLEN